MDKAFLLEEMKNRIRILSKVDKPTAAAICQELAAWIRRIEEGDFDGEE